MIDLRLGQMDPTDIRGIPYYNKELNKMDWAPPIDLPDQEMASQYPIVVLLPVDPEPAPGQVYPARQCGDDRRRQP